jgi:hypothetical protein
MPISGPPRHAAGADAVQRYLQAQEEVILPRFVSRRACAALWGLLVALAGAGAATWCVRVPAYVSGPAVVLDGRAVGLSPRAGTADDPRPVVAVFLPPESGPRLQVGQRLLLELGGARERSVVSVAAVEVEAQSPAALEKRFSLSGAAAHAVSRPAAVALAKWRAGDDAFAASRHVGSVYRAEVEIGARRAVSLLPLVGAFFGGAPNG